MGPQPVEAEPAVNRARFVEARASVGRVPVSVCDLEENTAGTQRAEGSED